MSQLELLWKLEYHNNQLDSHRKKLAIINNSTETQELEERHFEALNLLNELKLKLDSLKFKLIDNNHTLKDYEYRLKEIDIDLYGGKISDIKQLNYLSNEKDKTKQQVENIETKIINMMETSDSMEVDIVNIEEDLNLIIRELSRAREFSVMIANELENRINIEKEQIMNYSNEVESKLLKRYNTLRKNKGTGIVAIKDYICCGCNMVVPTYLIEKLRINEEILYCESCGRMLYNDSIEE